MTQSKTRSNRGNEPSIELVELSVVLAANANNPSILDLNFLRYNEIVNPAWQVQGSPVLSPALAQVSFEGGLTVTADLKRVIFEQKTGGKLVASEAAKRYLRQVPHVPYTAIGINPKFFLRSTGEHLPLMESVVSDQGTWMSFKDVVPTVQLKLTYGYETRTISLDVIQLEQTTDDPPFSGILFQANVHRDVDGPNAQARNKCIRSILDRWEDDLEDIRQLSKVLSGGMK